MGCRIMDPYNDNGKELLSPLRLAEQWIARLAVRAVIAKQKSGMAAVPDEEGARVDVITGHQIRVEGEK